MTVKASDARTRPRLGQSYSQMRKSTPKKIIEDMYFWGLVVSIPRSSNPASWDVPDLTVRIYFKSCPNI